MLESNFDKKSTLQKEKNRRIEDAEYIVIDTELTGLNGKKDCIVSIGALHMRGGRIDLSNTFYRLVNPGMDISAESVIIHEITPGEVFEKPDIDTVIAEFLQFCGSDIIIGYCVDIDMEFLNREMKRASGSGLRNPVLDIQPLFEWARGKETFKNKTCAQLPGQYRLYDIARCFGIPFNGGHNAVVNAFITAQIFQRLIPVLAVSGIRNVGDLFALSRRLKGGDKFGTVRSSSNF